MPPLRKLWLTAHRWFALSLGWVLAIMGITGALLMIGAPIDERLHAGLFKVSVHEHTSTVPLEQIRQRFVAGFGDGATFSFRGLAGRCLRAFLRSAGYCLAPLR
jgi:uncharacterized iron-regulated membrane protein